MSTVATLLESIRRELGPLDEQFRQHPYLQARDTLLATSVKTAQRDSAAAPH